MKRLPILIMLMAVAFSGTAMAAKGDIDPYGNVIDWEYDPNDLGEDSDIDDDTYTEETADPAATREYTPEEQESIYAVMSECATTAPSETGTVSVRLSKEPEGWSGDNITLSVYRGAAREDISLLAANGWAADAELPIGSYTVYMAKTNDGSTEFKADINSFEVTQNTPVTLSLTDASEVVTETAAASLEETESQDCRVVGIIRADDVPDESVDLVLSGKDATATLTLSRVKSYTASMYLPAGTYTVEKVAATDTDNPKAEYTAPSEITVSGDDTTTIEVEVTKKLLSDTDETSKKEEKTKSAVPVKTIVIAVCAIGLVALGAKFVIGRRKD